MAVVGANGSGKSTLLKGLIGELKPLGGHIDFDGLSRASIAYLPQASDIDRGFPASVAELVSLGLWRRSGSFRSFGRGARDEIEGAIMAVGLEGFGDRPIGTLSGGQLQRVLFARVLLQNAEVILLDEPFVAIDAKTVKDLIGLVLSWHSERRTVVAVLHSLELVRETFPQTLLLARQPVAWGDTREALNPENLLRAQRLHEAWDESAPWCGVQAQ